MLGRYFQKAEQTSTDNLFDDTKNYAMQYIYFGHFNVLTSK